MNLIALKNFPLLFVAIILVGCEATTTPPTQERETQMESSSSSPCGSEENPCPLPKYKKLETFQDREGNWIMIEEGRVLKSDDQTNWEPTIEGIWEIPGYWNIEENKPDGRSSIKFTDEGLFTPNDYGETWESSGGIWWHQENGKRIGITRECVVWETDGTLGDFPDENGMLWGVKVTD